MLQFQETYKIIHTIKTKELSIFNANSKKIKCKQKTCMQYVKLADCRLKKLDLSSRKKPKNAELTNVPLQILLASKKSAML